jgi:hypothetical protein
VAPVAGIAAASKPRPSSAISERLGSNRDDAIIFHIQIGYSGPLAKQVSSLQDCYLVISTDRLEAWCALRVVISFSEWAP